MDRREKWDALIYPVADWCFTYKKNLDSGEYSLFLSTAHIRKCKSVQSVEI